MAKVAAKSDYPSLRLSDLSRLSVPLPPPSEQKRIVRILDEAEALRQLRTQADARTRSLIDELYSQAFVETDERLAWDVESVKAIAEKRKGSIRTGPFGSQLLHSEFTNTGVPVLGIDNVVDNEFKWTAPRCVAPEKYQLFERFRVYPDDVLVTIMGTVGRAGVAPNDLPVCMSSKHLCVITLNRKKVHPRFLWAAFLYDPTIRQQTNSVGGGAIMEGWNSTIIKQLKIHIPPIAMQEEFAAEVAQIQELETAQAASRRRLYELFQSLLHRAFHGDL